MEKEKQLVKLEGDQGSSPEAPSTRKRGQEKREQRRCQERSDGEG